MIEMEGKRRRYRLPTLEVKNRFRLKLWQPDRINTLYFGAKRSAKYDMKEAIAKRQQCVLEAYDGGTWRVIARYLPFAAPSSAEIECLHSLAYAEAL